MKTDINRVIAVKITNNKTNLGIYHIGKEIADIVDWKMRDISDFYTDVPKSFQVINNCFLL